MKDLAYYNGKITSIDDMMIPANDRGFYFGDGIYEAAMVFDYKMAEKITSFTCPPRSLLNYRMHDAWVALIATLYGSFIYDENSYILYRIHSANTVGVKKDSVFKRLKLFLGWGKKTERYTNIRSLTAQLLLENENDYCAEDKKDKVLKTRNTHYPSME